RGLAYPRVAADQDEGAGYYAPAQDLVQLAHPQRQPVGASELDLAQRQRAGDAGGSPARARARRRGLDRLLHVGVPVAAFGGAAGEGAAASMTPPNPAGSSP